MNCPKCNKVIPIIRVIKSIDDAVNCIYCEHVIASETLVWKDGKFHFDILGDVSVIKLQHGPRKLMKNQSAKILDIRKILAKAKKYIREEPNINCVCSEFFITDNDIRLELLLEEL